MVNLENAAHIYWSCDFHGHRVSNFGQDSLPTYSHLFRCRSRRLPLLVTEERRHQLSGEAVVFGGRPRFIPAFGAATLGLLVVFGRTDGIGIELVSIAAFA